MKSLIEMLVYLIVAVVLSHVCKVDRTLRWTGCLASRLASRDVSTAWSCEDVARWMNRLSVLVPGAQCLDRAMAARWFMARRGEGGEVVIGFRARVDDSGLRVGWEGHAWVVWDDGAISFLSPGEGHKVMVTERSVS